MQCPVYIDVCSDLIPGVACRFVTDHVVGDIVLSFFIDRRGGRTCSGCLSCFSFVVDRRGRRT